MAVDFTAVAIPNLTSAQRAFELSSGEVVVVEVVRATSMSEDQAINLKVTAWQVDPNAGTKMTDSGVPIQIPGHVRSISLSGLADATVTIENEIADATAQAVGRFRNHIVAMAAWKSIPLAESKTA